MEEERDGLVEMRSKFERMREVEDGRDQMVRERDEMRHRGDRLVEEKHDLEKELVKLRAELESTKDRVSSEF